MISFRFIACFLLISFSNCKKSTKELPVLSYKIDNTGTKSYYKIHYEGFINQLGEPFEMKENKIYLANFFFTRCPSICPPMRTQLISLAEEFLEVNDVILISHTIDPEHDSISVLKTYSKATGIADSKWQFLRSSEEKTKLLAESYMTNFRQNEDGSDFYHSSFIVLVDQNKQIRGFYNSLLPSEIERLKEDMRQLLN